MAHARAVHVQARDQSQPGVERVRGAGAGGHRRPDRVTPSSAITGRPCTRPSPSRCSSPRPARVTNQTSCTTPSTSSALWLASARAGRAALLTEGVRETCLLLTSMLFLMSPEAGRPAAGEFDVRAGTDRVLLDAQEWRTELAAAGLDPLLELPEATSPVAAAGQTLFVARAV